MLRYLSFCSGLVPDFHAWRDLPFQCVGVADVDAGICWFLHDKFGAGRPRYMPSPEDMDTVIAEIDQKIAEADPTDETALKKLTADRNRAELEKTARRRAIKSVSQIPAEGKLINFGDITQVQPSDFAELGDIDFVIAGTPCQSFSVAGARLGFSDPRGNVTKAYLMLIEHLRINNNTQYAIWENVEGVLTHADNPLGTALAGMVGKSDGPIQPSGGKWAVSGHVSDCIRRRDGTERHGRQAAWRVMEASSWGVPQRRSRCFVVSNLTESGVCPGRMLFERKGNAGRSGQGSDAVVTAAGETGQMGAAGSGAGHLFPGIRGGQTGDRGDGVVGVVDNETYAFGKFGTITARKTAGSMPPVIAIPQPADMRTYAETGIGTYREGKLPTFRKSGGNLGPGSELIVGSATERLQRYLVRKAAPVEVERAFGLPDGWTDCMIKGKPASASFRYKALGNSIVSNCLQHIGEGLWREHCAVHGQPDQMFECAVAA